MIDQAVSNEVITKKITIEAADVVGASTSYVLLTSDGMVDPLHGGTGSTVGAVAMVMLVDSSALAAGSTGFFGARTDVTAAGANTVTSASGTGMRLDTIAAVAPGVGETDTYTLVVNGATTTMTHSITGAGTIQHSVGVISLPVASRLSVKVVMSGGAVTSNHAGSLAILTTGS